MSTEPDIKDTEPQDTSPYIRTYAQDFAALSGKKVQDTGRNKKGKVREAAQQHVPPPPPARTLEQEVSGSAFDESLITRDSDSQSETLNLDSTENNSYNVDAFAIPKHSVPPPPTQSSDEERAQILARLKERVKNHPIPAPVLAPQELAPIPAPIIEPIPEPPPVPVVTATKEPEPFHSFSTDFADRIEQQNASTFSVIAADKDAHVVSIPTRKKSPVVPVATGIIFIILGCAGIFAAYKFVNQGSVAVIAPSIPSLVTADQHVTLSGEGSDLMRALAQEANTSIPANSIVIAILNTSTTTSTGVIQAAGTGGALISALELPAPDILTRNIDPTSSVGVVNDGENTSVFFVLRVTSYERTFAGMLQWEDTMSHDLETLYPLYPATQQTETLPAIASTTSATSSPVQTVQRSIQAASTGTFVDEIVSNHNARALKDTAGRTLIIYGYADPQTLIIARDEAAFSLLLSRLTSQS